MGDDTALQFSTPRRTQSRHVHYDLDEDDGEEENISVDNEMEEDRQIYDEDVNIEYEDEVSRSYRAPTALLF